MKTAHFMTEAELTSEHHRRISDLLVLAFPRYVHLFRNASYYYSLPEYRLWLEDDSGLMVAHLDIERRTIGVNNHDVLIAGIGEVATHPDYHKQGLGRLLMEHLQRILQDTVKVDYGFLLCREEVVGFYERVGWHRVDQEIHEENIDTGEIQINDGFAMIMPIGQSLDAWQTDGFIDLRGLSW